ncbi:cytochrome aa3 quinol oxidase subunit IV [Paenibacillus sp. FSL W7-1287]|uniref:cytochrome aa3 quinol oxidase subunit IV n=1 Tax=Paenibacillus sp. FSL W7-1287 TaxID=2954538 RepID=UPI0030F4CCC0
METENKNVQANRFPWSQVIGFLLSIVLTFAAVWVGKITDLSYSQIAIIVFAIAFIQAAVQLFMFMHVTEGEQGKWQLGKMFSAAFFAIVIVAGSVWVMNSMH